MSGEPPTLDYRIADRSGPQDRLLLLVHGYGEDPSALLDVVDRVDPEGRFLAVAPTGPYEKGGKAIWHRAISGGVEDALAQLAQSLTALDALLDVLEQRTGLSRSDAVAGGFSQGGGLSIGLLLSAAVARPPAAVFGICSFPPPLPDFRVDLERAATRPLLMLSALRDRFAPIAISRDNAAVLADLGLPVSYHELDTDHELSDEAVTLLGDWLTRVQAGEVPTTPPPEVGDTTKSYLRAYPRAARP